MRITVVIPSHNRASLLEKTLASLTKQSNVQFQVLVVDHGSTDETGAVCKQYQKILPLTYQWLEKSADAPGNARHAAMQQVTTPLVVFLDCGVVVPSFYIEEHLSFHSEESRRVGVGLYHGLMIDDPRDTRWLKILEQTQIDEALSVLEQQPDLADQRRNSHLEKSSVPWLYGWSGNLSMWTEDYWKAGGFDLELEYCFEDVDLSYRLNRVGVRCALVEKGWGIHLPHPRPSTRLRRKWHYTAIEHCYRRHRSLGLETIFYTGMSMPYADQTFRYLSELGRDLPRLPSTTSLITRYDIPRPALLVGGTVEDAGNYEYVGLADEQIESTETLWSCSGVRIPLEDNALGSVVVSDMWKWLNRSFNFRNVTLLEFFIMEIKRTASQAFFLDSPDLPGTQHEQCSRSELSRLCNMYGLTFQVLSPEP